MKCLHIYISVSYILFFSELLASKVTLTLSPNSILKVTHQYHNCMGELGSAEERRRKNLLRNKLLNSTVVESN